MKISKITEGDTDISGKKTDKAYTELVQVFKKYKLNVKEMLVAYGNLGYALGASIGGYKDKGPSIDELSQLYALNPTVDVALMIQGITTTCWAEDLQKKIDEIKEKQSNDQGTTV